MPLPRSFVRNGLQNGIVRKQRIAGKIHLRNQAANESATEKRKVNMRRAPGIANDCARDKLLA